MPRSPLPEAPWYERAFSRRYLRIYPHRNDDEAEANADRLIEWLGVRSGQRVLDVACGEGRYARAFARRGLRVMGVDLSAELLQEARSRGRLLPGAPLYLRRDIRRLPFAGQFEGALSMFTSFGYFDGREDDLAIFRGVHRALVSGGRFVLDFLNESQVRSALVGEEEREESGLRIEIRRWIDDDAPGGPRVCKQVEGFDHLAGAPEFRIDETVRLYTADELDQLLVDAGFELTGTPMGDLDGGALDALSARYVRVAQKRPS